MTETRSPYRVNRYGALPVPDAAVAEALRSEIGFARGLLMQSRKLRDTKEDGLDRDTRQIITETYERQLLKLLVIWQTARKNARQPANRRTLESDLREDRY